MSNCKQCQTEFEGRADAEFCSAKCRALTARTRALMKTLPADVQHQIEKHCSENNNGARASSHGRAAMTERALAYQAKMGKRPGTGAHISDEILGEDAPILGEVGPLDVYSESRWAYLQSKGYEWDGFLNLATRPRQGPGPHIVTAVPVPGDPAYGPVGDNTCSECGKAVSSHKVGDKYFCCACYVAAGNPAAEWHKGCMKAYCGRNLSEDEVESVEANEDILLALR